MKKSIVIFLQERERVWDSGFGVIKAFRFYIFSVTLELSLVLLGHGINILQHWYCRIGTIKLVSSEFYTIFLSQSSLCIICLMHNLDFSDSSKFSRCTFFADCYFQTFRGSDFRESRVSSIHMYGILKFPKLDFLGLQGILENRNNYSPGKFGGIRYA